jgi:hypothetical protein
VPKAATVTFHFSHLAVAEHLLYQKPILSQASSDLLGDSLFYSKLSQQLGWLFFDFCDVCFTGFYCLIPTGLNEKLMLNYDNMGRNQ